MTALSKHLREQAAIFRQEDSLGRGAKELDAAAALIEQQADRIGELEALLVKANDAWLALSQPTKVDLGRRCFRCGHDAHLGDCVNLIPADAQGSKGTRNE